MPLILGCDVLGHLCSGPPTYPYLFLVSGAGLVVNCAKSRKTDLHRELTGAHTHLHPHWVGDYCMEFLAYNEALTFFSRFTNNI